MQFLAIIRVIYRFRKIISALTVLETGFKLYKRTEKLRTRRRDRSERKAAQQDEQ